MLDVYLATKTHGEPATSSKVHHATPKYWYGTDISVISLAATTNPVKKRILHDVAVSVRLHHVPGLIDAAYVDLRCPKSLCPNIYQLTLYSQR